MTKIKKSELDKFKRQAAVEFKKFKKSAGRKSAGDDIRDVKDQFSFSKLLKGIHTNTWKDADNERKYYKKALEQDDESKGGILVPTENSSDIIGRLYNKAVVRAMPNVRQINMKTDKMVVGRVESGPTVSWGGELETIAEDDSIRFGEISLEANKCVIIYPISRELLMNASTSVDDLVKDEIAKEMAEAEDAVLLEGTNGKQPLGIYNNPLVSYMNVAGTPSFEQVTTAMYQVEKNNLDINGWVGNPRTRQQLRTIKDDNGNWVLSHPSTNEGVSVETLYGQPAKWTNKVSKDLGSGSDESYLIGADWSQLYIGDKGGLRIESTTEGGDAFAKDEVLIKVVRYLDSAMRHPEGFTIMKQIKVS